jgi:KDO2-lipid IV(A) lauroyltransferase
MTSAQTRETDIEGVSASATQLPQTPLYRFWQPRYWPIWILLAVMRLLILLPLKWQLSMGRAFGRLMHRLMRKRRNIAAVNIRLCFPDKNESAVEDIVFQHFESLGMWIFELFLALWISDQRLARLVTLNGIEHMVNALEDGQGVILLSGHFAALELACHPVRHYSTRLGGLFRPLKNKFMNEIILRSRYRSVDQLIPKNDMRQMIRRLKEGYAMWYASDQSYDRKYSALVPFFDEPAMTSLALSHIARISKARVIPIFQQRMADFSGYRVDVFPALDNFPSDDPESDALRIHRLLEERIRQAPDEYYWVHRRFKGRPPGYPDPYSQI